MDALARSVALNGQGAQVQADLHQALVQRIGFARLLEVKRERAHHQPLVVFDGAGPAGLESGRFEEGAVVIPARVGGDVGGDHRPAQIGRRAAGANVGADLHAIECRADVVRQTGGRQGMNPAVRVYRQDGGRDLRGNVFHLLAHPGHQLWQAGFADHAFEHALLQHFMHLGQGDVGEHRDGAAGTSLCFIRFVDHHRYPARLAIAAVDERIAVVMPLQAQSAANGFRQALVRVRALQHVAEVTAPRFVTGEAKKAREALVDIHHLPVAVGQRDGVVAAIQGLAQGAVGQQGGRLMVQQSAWRGGGSVGRWGVWHALLKSLTPC